MRYHEVDPLFWGRPKPPTPNPLPTYHPDPTNAPEGRTEPSRGIYDPDPRKLETETTIQPL